jgi:hypothetical protein
MYDLNKLRSRTRQYRWFVRGKGTLSRQQVLAHLIEPLLEVLDLMATNQTRWLTLSELALETDKSRNYFEKPLKREGNRSRLEIWEAEGLAVKTVCGIWLISPIKADKNVDALSANRERRPPPKPRAAVRDAAAVAAALVA